MRISVFPATAVALAFTAALSSCSSLNDHGADELATSATSVASAISGSASSVASSVSSSIATPDRIDGPQGEREVSAKYEALGGQSRLGAPSGPPQRSGEGVIQPYARGTIYFAPSVGAHLVQGEILRVYTSAGGPVGSLGFPTTDESQVGGGPDVRDGGWTNDFEHGAVYWLNKGGGVFEETITEK